MKVLASTDLYEFTMAEAWFAAGLAEREAVFEIFTRGMPPVRRYLVAAGLGRIAEDITEAAFDRADIEALEDGIGRRLQPEFVAWLIHQRFRGDIRAAAEGDLVFAREPIAQIRGPLALVNLFETVLLSALNHDTKIASKAARVVEAARGRRLIEMGSRRTHEGASPDVGRAAYIAGFDATSNVEAGRRYGIPIAGTFGHVFTLSFPTEVDAFAAFVAVHGEKATLLVDTYDIIGGVEAALHVAGPNLGAVRIDSGDPAEWAPRVRTMLDAAGATAARIVVSGDLDEYEITRLVDSGCPVDVFGVGTAVATVPDSPALGAVYKPVAIADASGILQPVRKRSEGKATLPGVKNVWRLEASGEVVDLVAPVGEPAPADARPVLVDLIRAGKVVADVSAAAARARCASARAELSPALRRPEPEALSVGGDRAWDPVRISPTLLAAAEDPDVLAQAG